MGGVLGEVLPDLQEASRNVDTFSLSKPMGAPPLDAVSLAPPLDSLLDQCPGVHRVDRWCTVLTSGARC
jgi:hypothetical protein